MSRSRGTRVLMLLENGSYIGDTRVRNEATALISSGFQVSVICPRPGNRPWFENLGGVHVYRFPSPPSGTSFLGYVLEYGYAMVAMFLLTFAVLAREGFDLIHAHCPPDSFVLIGGFYKLLGKGFVYDHHDLAPEMYYYARFKDGGNRVVFNALVFLEKLSCRLADLVIATNESYKRMEMERGGVPEQRIAIVRNGPNLERLQLVEPDPELRQKARTLLGYVGGMGPQDGLDYLLRAVHQLVYGLEKRDVLCVIIGTGSVLPYLKNLATELQLDKYVWFTGWIPDEDMIRYLSTADICVDPDPSNPFNDRCTMIKMMEYMALGKPIVAFDLPEHRVTADEAAVYASPNDETDFARQIVNLMGDPLKRKKMGDIGRDRIASALAWQHQSRNLIHAYTKTFGDGADNT